MEEEAAGMRLILGHYNNVGKSCEKGVEKRMSSIGWGKGGSRSTIANRLGQRSSI